MKTVAKPARAQTSREPVPNSFEAQRVRSEFPILATRVHGKPLVYLDSAATTQKPRSVLDAVERYYTTENSNVHRGVHTLSQRATESFEGAREKARGFLGASSIREIVFTRGTTEALNLVAQSYARPRLRAGDEILLTEMEHHSNIVPWQLVAEQTGARLVVAPMTDEGALDLEAFAALLGERTKIVAVTHVSNALGTINPVRRLADLTHAAGAVLVVDGAQAAAHVEVDVQELGCDFYAISGHKMYAPTGIGALYGRESLLQEMPPWMGGGDMIKSVTFAKTLFNDLPFKFEAGTPNISGAVGLGAAIDFILGIGREEAKRYEDELLAYGTQRLLEFDGLRLVGTAPEKAGILSFTFRDFHPHDIGTILDREGIAVRTGHHCAQPTMERFGIPATTRASLAMYNDTTDLDALVAGLHQVVSILDR